MSGILGKNLLLSGYFGEKVSLLSEGYFRKKIYLLLYELYFEKKKIIMK